MKTDSSFEDLFVPYSDIGNKRFIPLSIDNAIKKDLQEELTQNGIVSDIQKYLERVYDSNQFKINLNYIVSYKKNEKSSFDESDTENKYKELWENRMKLLINKLNINFIKTKAFVEIYSILFSKESNNSESCYFVWQ